MIWIFVCVVVTRCIRHEIWTKNRNIFGLINNLPNEMCLKNTLVPCKNWSLVFPQLKVEFDIFFVVFVVKNIVFFGSEYCPYSFVPKILMCQTFYVLKLWKQIFFHCAKRLSVSFVFQSFINLFMSPALFAELQRMYIAAFHAPGKQF